MSEYTPTTEMVKTRYVIGHGGLSDDEEDIRAERFDRWLAAHDAEVRAQALADASAIARTYDTGYDTTAATIAEALADPGGVVAEEPEADIITIKRPVVPYGPAHMTENQATAHYLREVIHKIESGYTNVGGSNVTRTVKDLLAHVAMTLDRVPVDQEGADDAQ